MLATLSMFLFDYIICFNPAAALAVCVFGFLLLKGCATIAFVNYQPVIPLWDSCSARAHVSTNWHPDGSTSAFKSCIC